MDYPVAYYSYLSKHRKKRFTYAEEFFVSWNCPNSSFFPFNFFYQYSAIQRLIYMLNAPHLKHTSSKIIIILHL